jgi:hypothetical protein
LGEAVNKTPSTINAVSIGLRYSSFTPPNKEMGYPSKIAYPGAFVAYLGFDPKNKV